LNSLICPPDCRLKTGSAPFVCRKRLQPDALSSQQRRGHLGNVHAEPLAKLSPCVRDCWLRRRRGHHCSTQAALFDLPGPKLANMFDGNWAAGAIAAYNCWRGLRRRAIKRQPKQLVTHRTTGKPANCRKEP